MNTNPHANQLDQLIDRLSPLWADPRERGLLAKMVQALDDRYGLSGKIALEPGVADILDQMTGRLAGAFGNLSSLHGLKILDIACGSNSSRAPAAVHVNTPFGRLTLSPPQRLHGLVRTMVLPYAARVGRRSGRRGHG
jgi:hypothetical protein